MSTLPANGSRLSRRRRAIARRRCITPGRFAPRFESGNHTCTSYLEVAWEPDLYPFFLETRPRGLVFRDEKGNPLAGADLGSSQAPVVEQLAQSFDVPLPALPRSAAKIGLLQGQLSAIAPSKMLTFSFDTLEELGRLVKSDPKSPRLRQTKDRVTCTITRVTLTRSRWTIQVTVQHPHSRVRLDSSQEQSLAAANELILQARDGAGQIPGTRYVLEAQTEEGTELSYHFLDKDRPRRGTPGNWKVVYRAPAAIVEVPFSFAFKDVPLP
jgi:hypothetical protein